MTAPRRWLEDPDADEELRDVLRNSSAARSLDQVTRRRLRGRVARAATVPVVAAGWLFVKSATAALGVVLGTGALAVATGVVEWSPRAQPAAPAPAAVAPASPRAPSTNAVVAEPVTLPEATPEPVKVTPAPSLSLASPSASGAGSLSAEAALLEQARRQLRTSPAVALSVAAEHAQRFPRGQLASERALIQIDGLHRLGRDAEARALARSLLSGGNSGLYAERIQQLLGENLEP